MVGSTRIFESVVLLGDLVVGLADISYEWASELLERAPKPSCRAPTSTHFLHSHRAGNSAEVNLLNLDN